MIFRIFRWISRKYNFWYLRYKFDEIVSGLIDLMPQMIHTIVQYNFMSNWLHHCEYEWSNSINVYHWRQTSKITWTLRGLGGRVLRDLILKIDFLWFLDTREQELSALVFTASKNIVPSQSYGLSKLGPHEFQSCLDGPRSKNTKF